MEKIIKANGYAYLVKGDKGFETYYNLGKDVDSPIWEEKEKKPTQRKSKKQKKEND